MKEEHDASRHDGANQDEGTLFVLTQQRLQNVEIADSSRPQALDENVLQDMR